MRSFMLGALILAALAATACAADDSVADDDETSPPDTSLEVAMTDLAFSAPEITARAGERLRITFRNDGAVVHDFTIQEMPHVQMSTMGGTTAGEHGDHMNDGRAVHLAVDPRAEAVLDLRAEDAGTYEFFCSVPGHREAGMAGILRIQ